MIRKIIKALWIFLAVIVLAIVVIFVSISKGWIGYMPPVEELENPSYKFATEIFLKMKKCLVRGLIVRKSGIYSLQGFVSQYYQCSYCDGRCPFC